MSDQEKPEAPEAPAPAAPAHNNFLGIHRVGRMQILLTLEGEGNLKQPMARILKVVSPEELKQNPRAGQFFDMGDIASLEKICERALEHAIGVQSAFPVPAQQQPSDFTPMPPIPDSKDPA